MVFNDVTIILGAKESCYTLQLIQDICVQWGLSWFTKINRHYSIEQGTSPKLQDYYSYSYIYL